MFHKFFLSVVNFFDQLMFLKLVTARKKSQMEKTIINTCKRREKSCWQKA